MKDGNFGGYKYTKIQKTYIVDEEDEEVESSCYCWTCMKGFVKTLKLQLLKIQSGVSDQGFADLVQVFSRFDKNKDGVLDVQDLKVITKQAGIKLTEQELHEMLKAAGKNNNEKMELGDFVELMKNGTDTFSLKDEEIQDAFYYVQNSEGYITSDRLKSVVSDLGEELNDQDIMELIQKADLNGDGKIDMHEFKTIMRCNNDD